MPGEVNRNPELIMGMPLLGVAVHLSSIQVMRAQGYFGPIPRLHFWISKMLWVPGISQSGSIAEEETTHDGRTAEQAFGKAKEELWRSSQHDHVGALPMDFRCYWIFAVYASVADNGEVDCGGAWLVRDPSDAKNVGSPKLDVETNCIALLVRVDMSGGRI
jgi:hypothetical protein